LDVYRQTNELMWNGFYFTSSLLNTKTRYYTNYVLAELIEEFYGSRIF